MFRISRAFCQTMTSILPVDLNQSAPSSCQSRIVALLKRVSLNNANAILVARLTEMRFTTFFITHNIRLIS